MCCAGRGPSAARARARTSSLRICVAAPSGSRPCTSSPRACSRRPSASTATTRAPCPTRTKSRSTWAARSPRIECLPCALTIGTLLKTLRQQPAGGRHAFFMPSSKGPCRFGQYTVLHRQILDREGFEDVAILAPASNNAYQGLDSQMRRSLFKAIACADIILKAQCKVRPYEVNPGETDRVVAEVTDAVARALEKNADLPAVIREGIGKIAAIPWRGRASPWSASWARSTCATTSTPMKT